MGLRVKIEGSESINLPETSIMTVDFGADIPHDSNARSTDLGSTVLITGKILAAVDGEPAGPWFPRKTQTATEMCRSMW